MSRYRPPQPRSSPYITAAGHTRLQQELSDLWKQKRPEVTRRVAEAAALGDRSENAEYIYGKKQLREIDARIRFLSKRLDEVEIIDRKPAQTDRVYFSAWVTLDDETGNTQRYRIVGADEFDQSPEYISIDAPLARALIGKQLGDSVCVVRQSQQGTPRILERQQKQAEDTYVIADIDYD